MPAVRCTDVTATQRHTTLIPKTVGKTDRCGFAVFGRNGAKIDGQLIEAECRISYVLCDSGGSHHMLLRICWSVSGAQLSSVIGVETIYVRIMHARAFGGGHNQQHRVEHRVGFCVFASGGTWASLFCVRCGLVRPMQSVCVCVTHDDEHNTAPL